MYRHSCPSRSGAFGGIRQSAKDSCRNIQTVANDHNGTARSLSSAEVLTAPGDGQRNQNPSPAWPANWPEGEQDVARSLGFIRRTRFFKRLCTRICKSAHSTRLSGNKDFGLPQAPNDDICTKMGRIAGFAVEMTLRGTYGGVFTDEFLSVPRSLETRTKRGVSTFHTATTAAAPDLAVKPNPLKSRALSDSCALTGQCALIFRRRRGSRVRDRG